MSKKDEIREVVSVAVSIVGLIRVIIGLFTGKKVIFQKGKPCTDSETSPEQLPD